jgi:hypothetical protein
MGGNPARDSLIRIIAKPKTGREAFRAGDRILEFELSDFWRWSMSDLVSNATRGHLAEFIVAKALSISTDTVRDEWGAYDLEMSEGISEGIKVEVKSASYIQSWHQSKLSSISFRTPKTIAWNAETGQQDREAKRQADVYVFALLWHQEKSTIDPLNVRHWRFYVLPTTVLDARTRSQHSITLRTLEVLAGRCVPYEELRYVVIQAVRSGGKPGS